MLHLQKVARDHPVHPRTSSVCAGAHHPTIDQGMGFTNMSDQASRTAATQGCFGSRKVKVIPAPRITLTEYDDWPSQHLIVILLTQTLEEHQPPAPALDLTPGSDNAEASLLTVCPRRHHRLHCRPILYCTLIAMHWQNYHRLSPPAPCVQFLPGDRQLLILRGGHY